MKTPKLSFEAIAAALAVLSVTGCDKAASEKAAPAPESKPIAASASATPPVASAAPGTPSDQGGAASAAPSPASPPKAAVVGVDAGPGTRTKNAGGNASCGAGSCSADMKKGK